MTAFDDLSGFARLYPEMAGTLTHTLAGHPRFTLDALLALAARMRPADVEYSRGDLPVGVDPGAAIGNGLSIDATIRGIEENGSWMVLKFVEQDAAYRALLDEVLDALLPVVAPATGPMLKREGYVFLSSPGAMTPFHFDPEHNILMQLRGTKAMTVFPHDDEAVAASAEHERFHLGGHRNLPWRDALAAKGVAFDLAAGDAVYVPVKAPHFVRNGPEVSISFSVTWRSAWSYAEADARGMNARLRRAGLSPAAPPRWPKQARLKALAHRALRRLRV